MLHLENSAQITQKSGNRTRVEILADILTVASRGALKTRIMYRANLSHRQLEKYIQFLEDTELLQEVVDDDRGGRYYRVTEKGTQFLKEYSQLSKYLTAKTP